MDELKNENVTEQQVAEDAAVEQRPSTKYGRTAYQQQMQEEQAVQTQTEPVQEQPQQNQYQYWEGPQNPYQQNANQQSNERPYQQYQQYQQSNQPQYEQPQYNAYTAYEEPKPEVKNVFAYILMALVALSVIVGFVVNVIVSQAYSMGNSLEEVVDATLVLSQQPTVLILSTITDVLFWITVALLVFDIIQLHKAGKKIGGAIAFAILLRPAYFIWRAHLLGQKKVMPIIYTIVVYLISFAQFAVLMSASMEMVMRTMY